ncbi:MAG: DUF3991 domain-containing protein [Oscillospiraceae bacterium]
MAHDKLLYQDTRGNAVFVHRDDNGKIVGAEIQGTNFEKRYKGVAQGTRESVFTVKIGQQPNKCYVFEWGFSQTSTIFEKNICPKYGG